MNTLDTKERIDNGEFPVNLTLVELHALEGSLWKYDDGASILMFCHVGRNMFSMIDLESGDSDFCPLTVKNNVIEYCAAKDELCNYTSFRGSVMITTV